MIRVDIEKEIQQENKILFGLNIRQIICLGAAGIVSTVLVLVFGLSSDILIYPMMVVGIVAFAFGWKKYDGLPMERVLMRKAGDFVYHNNKRPYRTKNAYIPLLNREYDRMRRIDGKDKRIGKAIRRENRRKAKMRKKSKLKGIR